MADKVMDALNAIASNVESLQVKAGFIDGATYPDGTPVAMVAAVMSMAIQPETSLQAVLSQCDCSTRK
jgi:hypothetical protein